MAIGATCSAGRAKYAADQNKTVEEIWYQIGERLREAREGQGLTVADVAHLTRIHWSVIEALEAEEFAVFSSPLYAKSFLAQYSAFVGVDASSWMELFEPAPFVGPEVLEPLLDAGGAAPVAPPRNAAASRDDGSSPALLVLCATGLLVFAAVVGYRFYENRFGDDATAGVVAAPAAEPAAEAGDAGLPPVVLNTTGAPADDTEGEAPPPRAIIVREP